MPLKMGSKTRIINSFIIISILMKNQKVHVNETFKNLSLILTRNKIISLFIESHKNSQLNQNYLGKIICMDLI